jgi:hypothetical protein
LRFRIKACDDERRSIVLWGNPTRSRAAILACVAAAFSLSASAGGASARAIVFDSLDGATSALANTAIDRVMSATFTTGALPLHADIALMLSAPSPEEGERGVRVTISLDGGIPLSDLSFDPMNGLSYLDGSSVDFQGPVIKPIIMPVARLPRAPTVEQFDQFADVSLNPNSLYWIEVSVNGESDVNWGMTNDVSGPGVASNYLAWFGTDDGFFLNRGVRPFLADNALQMEVEAAPEPSTWLLMVLGFAGLGFLARRGARGAVPA